MAATFIYSDERAKYVYGAHHPLKPIRLQLTYELMQVYDLLTVDRCCTIPAPAASMNELSCFHTVEYLDVLQAASEGQGGSHGAYYGLGPGNNPIFPGMFRFSALIAGASLQAAQVVDAGATRVAFNIAGGLYHGMPSRASGFCYLNDVVLAIGTGQVLTIFLHESSKYLFPGTSFEDEIGEGAGLLHECPECPAPPVYGR